MSDYSLFKFIDAQFRTETDPTNPSKTRFVAAPDIEKGNNFTDLATLTVPLANDRALVLNGAVTNQFKTLGDANERIGALNFAMQELQKISPTGVTDNKAKTDIPGYDWPSDPPKNIFHPRISKQAWLTLSSVKDASGTAVTDLFVATGPHGAEPNQYYDIDKMKPDKTFAQVTTIMKSAIDQASQNNQLEMTSLQGLTNKYNQSIETMSDLVSKFADIGSKLVSNFRPLR